MYLIVDLSICSCRTGTAYPSGEPEFAPDCSGFKFLNLKFSKQCFMGHTTRSLFIGLFIFDYELFVLRFKVFDYPFDL